MAEWEEGKNPLLIDLVIENISKYLTFEELKVCRRLNHRWKKTTNRIFLKLCPFISLDHSRRHVTRSERKMRIPQFIEIYSDPNHPHPQAQLLRQYRNFSLFGLENEECIPIFYNFMTQVGHQMTRLHLTGVYVLRNLQDLMDIVSCKYTPKLEDLFLCMSQDIKNYKQSDSETLCIERRENKHLRELGISIMADEYYNAIQWLDVLSRYPKLKTLFLEGISADLFENMANGLVTIRKIDETKLKLTKLEISLISYDGITEAETKAGWRRIGDLLKTANLPLEEIRLDESLSEISLALLQHYGENLKSLTLDDSDSIPQPFPLMKALEEMKFGQCDDLTFLTKVPNLKSLCMYPYPDEVNEYGDEDGTNSDEISFPELPPSSLMSITNFSCGIRKKWNITEMERLLLWIPNVQKLEMRLNNTTFSWICQHLPNLKELTVHGQDLDDSGVVGEFDRAFHAGCRSNITNLKGLETFRMADMKVLEKKGLTEKSVFYGFSLMPMLSKLTLKVKSEFSGATMRALKRGIKSVQIKVASKEGKDYD